MLSPLLPALTLLAALAQQQPPAQAAVQPAAQPAADKPAAAAPAPHKITLRVGDPSPDSKLPIWSKQRPFPEVPKNQIFVLQFWSSTDAASLRAIPILSELQTLFKSNGVTIIGINVAELGGMPDVEDFITANADKINYTIGYDADASFAKAFLEPSGQDSIPVCFVLTRDKKIAWIGHPLDSLDRILTDLTAGTYDLAAARTLALRREEAAKKSEPLIQKLEEEFTKGNVSGALKVMDDLVAVDPPITGDWAMTKFAFLLLQKKDAKAAYAYAREITSDKGPIKDNADILKAIAWMILDEPGVPADPPRDLALARSLASRANDLTKGQDPSVLDTLAKAQFDSGEIDPAITTLSRALELAKLPSQKKEIEARSKFYRSSRSPEPRPTNEPRPINEPRP